MNSGWPLELERIAERQGLESDPNGAVVVFAGEQVALLYLLLATSDRTCRRCRSASGPRW